MEHYSLCKTTFFKETFNFKSPAGCTCICLLAPSLASTTQHPNTHTSFQSFATSPSSPPPYSHPFPSQQTSFVTGKYVCILVFIVLWHRGVYGTSNNSFWIFSNNLNFFVSTLKGELMSGPRRLEFCTLVAFKFRNFCPQKLKTAKTFLGPRLETIIFIPNSRTF